MRRATHKPAPKPKKPEERIFKKGTTVAPPKPKPPDTSRLPPTRRA